VGIFADEINILTRARQPSRVSLRGSGPSLSRRIDIYPGRSRFSIILIKLIIYQIIDGQEKYTIFAISARGVPSSVDVEEGFYFPVIVHIQEKT